MSRLKKLIAIGTTATMLLWSFGMVIPAQAATIVDGDLVKTADSSAVYYIQGSSKRVFPHFNVYLSWGYPEDFSTVKTVSASELAAYTDENPMPFRDGSLFRGTTTSLEGKDATAVFYVEDGELRPVLSEQVYQGLFSDPNWARVTWVPDDLLSKFNYDMGSDLTSSATHPDGTIVKYAGSSQRYLIQDGKKRAISDAAFSANRYLETSVVTIDNDEVYADGAAITGVESGLLTPGWLAGSGTTTSALTASLYNTFAPSLMLGNSTNNGLLQVKLTAGSSAVSVDSLTFKRSGIGDTDDWTGLYLDVDSSRVTNSRTLSTDNHTVEFSGLGLNVPANSYKTVTLKGDLAALGTADQGNRHIFSLTTVDTTATVNGLPLNGNTMEVGAQDVSSVTISMGTNPSDPSVGSDNVEVANFKITAGANNISVNQLVVTFGGTLSTSEVSNLKLYDQNGDLVSSVASVGAKDRATFNFSSPYAIADSNAMRFSVKADVLGKVAQYLYAMIEEDSHLNATDLLYNVSAAVDNTDVDTTAEQNVTARRIDLQGGAITIAENGPNAGKITKNANDVTILKFSITPETNVTVKDLDVTLKVYEAGEGVVAGDISDLKVKDADTGSTLASLSSLGTVTYTDATYVEFGGATSYDGTDTNTFNLSDDFSISANNTRNFIVTIDTANTDTVVDAQITAGIELGATADYVKDDDSNEFISQSDIVPTSVTGNAQTVEAPTLAASRSSLPTSNTFVVGATDVPVLGLILTAGEADDIDVSKITGYLHADDTSTAFGSAYDAKNAVDSISIYDGDTLVKTVGLENYSSSKNAAIFDSLDITVPAGESKTLNFKANISSSISSTYLNSGNTFLYFEVDPSAASDSIIIAYDQDSRDVDVSGSANAANTVAITVTEQGGLTAALDANSPDSTIVVMGNSAQEVSKVKFTATNEGYVINKLTVLNLNAAGSALATTTEISSIDLYWDGGSRTGLDLTGGQKTISGLNIEVPQDGTTVLTIKANLNTWSGQAVSGNVINLGIRENDTSTYFEAVGSSSGETIYDLSLSGGLLGANPMYVRRTKPTIAASDYSGALGNKQMDLITFTVSADANEDVALKRISFDYSVFDATSAGNSVNNIELYRGSTKIVQGTDIGTISDISNTTSTSDVLSVSWLTAKEEVIPAGETRTYTLKGTGQGFAEDDSFSIRVAEEVNTDATELTNYNTLSGDSYLIWSDHYEGVTHSAANDTTEYDWCAGTYVDTLPSDWSSWTQ
ncbi:hypothetical protein K9K85_03070 [Patescibacteria group bacterium]|nr:hypothetical protein [Patescibacteria group bacterium]